MSLEQAHQHLGWPAPEDIRNPSGAGPKVIAQLAKDKIGNALARMPGGNGVNVGILAADAETTQSPLAIVCEFSRPVPPETLYAAHRLAWNFCRSPLLITVEPNIIRKWTCCEPPVLPENTVSSTLFPDHQPEIGNAISFGEPLQGLAAQATQSLNWINLVSGQFFKEEEKRFDPQKRADRLLLENLRFARKSLMALGLNEDITHDLLARIIFIQFLFDRKDASGISALNPGELNRLYTADKISAQYKSLAEILSDYDDSYRLFRLLNTTFNGDLFPGKGQTTEEQEVAWRAETDHVKPEHLSLLARFISGEEKMADGQRILWRQYAFDALPIEFISSIYEEFVKKSNTAGVHYTPSYLVDFMLDGVLPWDSLDWDLKILDPACGSGVFLVKAYQRLIHRWKNAHKRLPEPAVLQHLLEHNLFGVDKDKDAVRVASFSLYLAMCDQIEPRDYWTKVHFPPLRNHRLMASDFFNEDQDGIRTGKDTDYDLVIGNAPWGKNLITEEARQWANKNDWTIANDQIGTLFLAKSLALVKSPVGQVSMILPAGALLFNRSSTAKAFRFKLFSSYKVDEVVNLSALRFTLFPNAVGPACLLIASAAPADNDPILYMCPKPLQTSEDEFRFVIEHHEIHWVYPDEALDDMRAWINYMWGGNRDRNLLRRFIDYPTIIKLKQQKKVFSREGIIWGDGGKEQTALADRRILDADDFPDGSFLRLNSNRLPVNTRKKTHSKDSTKLTAFGKPQILVKQSWLLSSGRFQACLIEGDDDQGVLCTQSYVSISVLSENRRWLEAACLSYNSIVAVYYLLLTSSRFAPYRPEVLVEELLNVPLPEASTDLLEAVDSYKSLDSRAKQAFNLRDAEWALIEDLNQYTLPDFKGDDTSPGRQSTCVQNRGSDIIEPVLTQYCDYFIRVLKASFGQDKSVCATIYHEDGGQLLPLRLVAVHLDWPGRDLISTEATSNSGLYARLQELYQKLLKTPEESKLYYQRVIRMYDTVDTPNGKVPTIYIIKPNQIRYWTRSMGLRDADEVSADILMSADTQHQTNEVVEDPA